MTHRLPLTEQQRTELEQLMRSAPQPYLRERAAALLRIAAGQSATAVARTGLLHPRNRKTILDWLARYRTEGTAGLHIRPGRGRKPAFSPSPSRRGGRSGSTPPPGPA